jgi:hypothetical protein
VHRKATFVGDAFPCVADWHRDANPTIPAVSFLSRYGQHRHEHGAFAHLLLEVTISFLDVTLRLLDVTLLLLDVTLLLLDVTPPLLDITP